jgi:arylsulfatase A
MTSQYPSSLPHKIKVNKGFLTLFASFPLVLSGLNSCSHNPAENTKPNLILIMADDMGYECLSSNGSISYSTPQIDSLAAHGIRFTHCISQPLCTPSRVKIMTGLYNYRNYEYFDYLNPDQTTFGNIMHDAGYVTCISGKWQLNGISYKKEIPAWDDINRPNHFGFDEYCLWQLTKTRKEGERYADPLIEKNGSILKLAKDSYGPDIFSDYVIDFIERHKDKPFFVYYPMVLVHDPFVPTPDSKSWPDRENRYRNDTANFKDMVAYTDKIVGKIHDKLVETGLDDNTILIFTGDNGTNIRIVSYTRNDSIRGGKGNTIDAGTRVPLVIHWPASITRGRVYTGLVEFSDFFPTLAEISGTVAHSDGQSFYSLLNDTGSFNRTTAFVNYDPRWSQNVNRYRNRFSRTIRYKLYQDGKFYDLSNDVLEKHPIPAERFSPEMTAVKDSLQAILDKAPEWKETVEE